MELRIKKELEQQLYDKNLLDRIRDAQTQSLKWRVEDLESKYVGLGKK